MYITLDEYTALYDPMDEKQFNCLAFDACRAMDLHTTGIDGAKKLRIAFPIDEYDTMTVKHCAAKLVNLLHQIQEAESAISQGRGYTTTANGLQGKVISSVSAGNESVSYSVGSSPKSVIDNAVLDKSEKDKLIRETVREYLSGVADANGVNLLYMGRYPRRYLC